MTEVFFWLGDFTGCGHFRGQLPAKALADTYGWKTTAHTDLPTSVRPDILVGQRVCRPDATASWQALARKGDRPLLVFEIDDDLWSIERSNRAAHHFYNADTLSRLLRNAEVADLVTVTTDTLATKLVDLGVTAPIAVLPNYIDESVIGQSPSLGQPAIGWAGGSSHTADFNLVVNPLKRLLRSRSDATVSIGGPDWTRRVSSRQTADRVRWIDWVEDVPSYYSTLDFAIGLAPLTDTPFNRARSWIKALDYASQGIPTIASAVGPYNEWFDQAPGSTFLASNEREWTAQLNQLLNDADLYSAASVAAHEAASANTIQRNIHRWHSAYQSALSDDVSVAA